MYMTLSWTHDLAEHMTTGGAQSGSVTGKMEILTVLKTPTFRRMSQKSRPLALRFWSLALQIGGERSGPTSWRKRRHGPILLMLSSARHLAVYGELTPSRRFTPSNKMMQA